MTLRQLIDFGELVWKYPRYLDSFLRRYVDRLFPWLYRFARLYRLTLLRRKRIVVVVGSLGKTSTTAALRTVLMKCNHRQSFSNYGSRLVHNVLRSRPWEPLDVIEVGINGPNQMQNPARLLRPDVVVVTSIASDHNRSLPTLEETRREKVKMVQALPPGGLAVLNGDDPNVMWMATQTDARVMTFGLDSKNDVWADDVQLDWPHGSTFTLRTPIGEQRVRVQVIGQQMIRPLLAATCAAIAEGMSLDTITSRLETVPSTPTRMEVVGLDNGAFVIDDSIKASLESIESALLTLAKIPAQRRIVILSEVEEPPASQSVIYGELGRQVARSADRLIFVPRGKAFQKIRAVAKKEGMPAEYVSHASNEIGNVVAILQKELQEGDVVLVKGAHALRFRRILLQLQGIDVRCQAHLCKVKIPTCGHCALLQTDTTQLRNSLLTRLLTHRSSKAKIEE